MVVKIIISVAIIFVAIALWPVKVTCHVPGWACATAPDKSGTYYTGYDIEPFFVQFIEMGTKIDFPIKYWTGEDGHPLK